MAAPMARRLVRGRLVPTLSKGYSFARRCEMKRLLVVGGVAVGAVFVARRLGRGCSGFDIEKKIERMPEGSRPKWMFRNIGAIRQNTERILELLESEPGVPADRPARTAA